MTRGSNRRRRRRREPTLREVVRSVLHHIHSPARVIELYYWSQEEKLCDVIRAIVVMPPETREVLEAFLSMTRADTVTASLDTEGRLTLSSPDVSETLNLLSGGSASTVSWRAH